MLILLGKGFTVTRCLISLFFSHACVCVYASVPSPVVCVSFHTRLSFWERFTVFHCQVSLLLSHDMIIPRVNQNICYDSELIVWMKHINAAILCPLLILKLSECGIVSSFVFLFLWQGLVVICLRLAARLHNGLFMRACFSFLLEHQHLSILHLTGKNCSPGSAVTVHASSQNLLSTFKLGKNMPSPLQIGFRFSFMSEKRP